MLIDDFLPTWDVKSEHSITLLAPPDRVFTAVLTSDLSGSAVVRALFALRGLPRSALRLEGLLHLGFVELARAEGRELVLGLLGRFWTPSGSLVRVSSKEFTSVSPSGFSKAAWNFLVRPVDAERTELLTQTRIKNYGAVARALFRLYWLAVGPFSGVIRLEMLREIRRRVESPGETRPS